VLVSREHLAASGGTVRAIIVNSGCANACTGDDGLQVARDMAVETATLVGCPIQQVLVASTGVIGVGLPIEKIRHGLPIALRALREAVDDTFNAITVDGDSSTNDSVMLLANGASGATVDDRSYSAFLDGLRAVCLELALGIVRGGEGATKLVTVTVTGAATGA